MYKRQVAKLPKVFESVPSSVAAALGIMKPYPPNRATVGPENKDRGWRVGPIQKG